MTHIGQLFFGLQPNELVPILSIVQENMLQKTKILHINSNEKKLLERCVVTSMELDFLL